MLLELFAVFQKNVKYMIASKEIVLVFKKIEIIGDVALLLN